jgi:uncharacterized membrane protein YheB (UPF0754 family)
MQLIDEIVAGGWQTWIIPLVSAFVGWWTNAVAVRMMFEPKEFVGIKPYLGWQGIVPASAMSLAKKSVDLILGQLITVRDLFAGFDGKRMSGELGPALDGWTDEILNESVAKYAPELWAQMAEPARATIRQMLRAEIEGTAADILDDFHKDVEKIIDLRKVVLTHVAENRELISEIFLTVGKEEFRFIKLSGLYFGLPFGLLQMIQWVALPVWWTLPVAGFAVGYATNWLAMKMIFDPKEPKRFGPWTVQGLFHKRQREVSRLYSETIAQRVMNPENIVRTITTGEHGDILFGIVNKHVLALLDKYEKNPMAAMLFPADKRADIRAEMLVRMKSELPRKGGFLYQFTEKAMDIQGELFRRMDKLDPEAFEGVLRPAFQQDEWKLIVVGGVLGLAAGFVQLVTCFDQIWSAAMN